MARERIARVLSGASFSVCVYCPRAVCGLPSAISASAMPSRASTLFGCDCSTAGEKSAGGGHVALADADPPFEDREVRIVEVERSRHGDVASRPRRTPPSGRTTRPGRPSARDTRDSGRGLPCTSPPRGGSPRGPPRRHRRGTRCGRPREDRRSPSAEKEREQCRDGQGAGVHFHVRFSP